MTMDDILTFFEEKGVQARVKSLQKSGVTQTCFGVSTKHIQSLSKKIKTNHILGLELWKSKYFEAMLLSSMILDGKQLTETELQHMVEEIDHWLIIDYFVRYVVIKSNNRDILARHWINHSCFLVSRAGWMIEVEKLIQNAQPESNYEALLEEIKHKMKYAHPKKQEAMNYCLVLIGTTHNQYLADAIDIATTIGKLDNYPTNIRGVSSYAPEWIHAILQTKQK